jgi:hypothetical protein
MKLRVPEIVLGAFLTVAVFAAGMTFRSSLPPPQDNVETSHQKGAKQESAKATADERIADYTWWLAVLTGGLVVSGVIQFGFLLRSDRTARIAADAARDSADVAGKTLVAANRPWISADISIASDLTFGAPAAAQMTFKFILKNTGNTPGVSVEIRPKLTILELGVSAVGPPADYSQPVQTVPEKALMDLCQTAKIFGDAVFPDRPITGDAIFPGDTLSHRVTMQLSKDEVEKARASSYHKVLNLMLLVCVNYKSPLATGSRQTGYIFFVSTNDPAHPNGIDPAKGNISISNLGLTRTFSSSFAD